MRLYHELKSSSKKRGIAFTLTYPYFKLFIAKENYLERQRGRSKEAVSVDRIDPDPLIGYADGNIQVLTKNANIDKYWKLEWNGIETMADENTPF